MTTKREITEYLKLEVNEYKHDLMRVQHEMEDNGLKREAKRLDSIIGNLEHWQNTG